MTRPGRRRLVLTRRRRQGGGIRGPGLERRSSGNWCRSRLRASVSSLASASGSQQDLLTRLYAPAGAALLIVALAALMAQSMLTTILRRREVEKAVIERTAELRALNQTLRSEVEQRRQAESRAVVMPATRRRAPIAPVGLPVDHELRTAHAVERDHRVLQHSHTAVGRHGSPHPGLL